MDDPPDAVDAPPDKELLGVARELLSVLREIKDQGFGDDDLILTAKILHAKLAPVYVRIYGEVFALSTNYPARVWWPRAWEWATDALAAIEAGLLGESALSPSRSSKGNSGPLEMSEKEAEASTSGPAGTFGEIQSCFVVGPIGDKDAPLNSEGRRRYEDGVEVWEKVVQPACAEFGLEPLRSDLLARPGEIPEQIFRRIRDDDLVIADVTDGNANVMYELGIRHTIDRPTIQIGERQRLPFDITVIRTIEFVRTEGGLIEARKRLTAAIAAVTKGEYDRVSATRIMLEVGPIETNVGEETKANDQSSEPPGFLELLAETEKAFPEIVETLGSVTGVIKELGELAVGGNKEVELIGARGGGASAGLSAAIRFARTLEEPAQRLGELSQAYEDQMKRVDPGILFIIGQLEENPHLLADPTTEEWASVIQNLAPASRGAMEAFRNMSESVKGLEPAASALRPPARKIRSALARIEDATQTIEIWNARLNSVRETFQGS